MKAAWYDHYGSLPVIYGRLHRFKHLRAHSKNVHAARREIPAGWVNTPNIY